MKVVLTTLLLAIAITGFSQAELKFDHKEHDFGTIKEKEKVSHDFTFKNVGNAPLILSNVMIACDCTTSEWPQQPIMPGKEGTIKVMFDSEGKDGQQKKSVGSSFKC